MAHGEKEIMYLLRLLRSSRPPSLSRALILLVTHLALTGILAAVAVSLATNDEEFIQRAKEAVVLSFWIGLRAQQVRVNPANA